MSFIEVYSHANEQYAISNQVVEYYYICIHWFSIDSIVMLDGIATFVTKVPIIGK